MPHSRNISRRSPGLEFDVRSKLNAASGSDQRGALPKGKAGRADVAHGERRVIEDVQELSLNGHADRFTDGHALVHREIGVEPVGPINVVEVGQYAGGHVGREVIGRDGTVGTDETRTDRVDPGISRASDLDSVLDGLPSDAGCEYHSAVGHRIERGITAAKLHRRAALYDDDR